MKGGNRDQGKRKRTKVGEKNDEDGTKRETGKEKVEATPNKADLSA
jgi:hypothetical protein